MNKKVLAAVGISGALMLGSVYSISANTSGYELYKSALKQTHQADSATVSMKMSLEDNEQAILTADSIFKSDSGNNMSAVTTQLANQTETSKMNMYKQNGNWYVMKEGLDSVYQMDFSNNPHHSNTAELQDDVENLIDVMTKNLQQQITVTEQTDGDHFIELDLTGKEIPLTAHAFSTLMIKHAVMIQDNQDSKDSQFHIQAAIPELDHDITFKQVKISAEVNELNYIEQQTVKAVVTGKDKQGSEHELSFNLTINGTDFNQTIVAPIDIPTDNLIEFNHSQLHK